MGYRIWLFGNKICSADEIPDNPDILSLRSYYLGGKLYDWLNENGGEEFAEKLRKIDTGKDLLREIGKVFGINAPPSHTSIIEGYYPPINEPAAGIRGSFALNGSFNDYGSFNNYGSYKNYGSLNGSGSYILTGSHVYGGNFFNLCPLNRYGYGIHLI